MEGGTAEVPSSPSVLLRCPNALIAVAEAPRGLWEALTTPPAGALAAPTADTPEGVEVTVEATVGPASFMRRDDMRGAAGFLLGGAPAAPESPD